MNAAVLPGRVRSRIAGLWRTPVHRTGYLLLLSSVLTGALGMVFWLVVARMYPPDVVGRNSTVISIMQFLSAVAQLNLMSALVRFVPGAAPRARAMIGSAFAVSAALSVVAALVFLFGMRWWAPGLQPLLHSTEMQVGFVVATVVWTILSLVSPALVAASHPGAVPVTHGAFAGGKIVVAIAIAGLLPTVGIWISWVLAATLTLFVAVGYLFWRAVPAFIAAGSGRGSTPTRRDLARYIGPDYVGFLGWFGALTLTPVLVFNIAGAQQAAVFTFVWAIVTALYEVATAFGESQLAAGAVDPASLEVHFRQALRHVLVLLVAPVAVLLVAAPRVLALFGPFYAEHGSGVLRLLALSAFPSAVLTLEVARARVLRRLTVVAVGLVVVCGGVLVLAAVLARVQGIAGAGTAWLIGLSVAAAAASFWHLRGHPAPAGEYGATVRCRTVVATVARQTAQAVTVEGRRRTVTDTAVLLVRTCGRAAVLKAATSDRGAADVDHEAAVLLRLHAAAEMGGWRTLLPEVLAVRHTGDVRAAGGPVGAAAGGAGRAGPTYLVTARITGNAPMGVTSRHLTESALAALEPLHRWRAECRTVDDALLERYVGAPGRVVAAVLPDARRRGQLERLLAGLRGDMVGREVTVGWVHGDYSHGNVLVTSGGAVSGIVDWAQSDDRGLPVIDRANWLLTSGPHATGGLGRQVTRRWREACWTAWEWQLLEEAACGLPGSAVLRLTWLRHVANNLEKSLRYAASILWIPRVIYPVLQVADRCAR